MKILCACEESQAVTKAFRELGHEAYSCDLQEASGDHPEWHIQGDVTELLAQKWDMVIAFPPCTHLATSGAKHFAKKRADGRQQEAIDFFLKFTNINCDKVCIENPVGIMSTQWRKPDQIVQPWQFGHNAQKSTCLWLKGLTPLRHTNVVDKGEFYVAPSGKRMPKWYSENKSAKIRSKTFDGIAKAMAEHWG